MKRLFLTHSLNSVRDEMTDNDLAFRLPSSDFYNFKYSHILETLHKSMTIRYDKPDIEYELNYKIAKGYVEEFDVNGSQSFFFDKNGKYIKIKEFESYFDIKREKDVFGIRHENVFLRKRNDLLNYLRSFDKIILKPEMDFRFIKELVLFFKVYLNFQDDYLGRYNNLADILRIEEINVYSKNKENIIDINNIEKNFSNIIDENHIIHGYIRKYEAIEIFNFNFNLFSSMILQDILRAKNIYSNKIIDLETLRTLHLIEQEFEIHSYLLHSKMIARKITNSSDTEHVIDNLKLLGFIEEKEVIKITDSGYEFIDMLSDSFYNEKFYLSFFDIVKDTPINELVPYRKEIACLNDMFMKQKSHQTKKILKQISSYITEY